MIQIKVTGLAQVEQLTLNIQKNTPKFIGSSAFDVAKLTARIGKQDFIRRHSKWGTGKSAKTIMPIKISNSQSQVLANNVVSIQENGTNPSGSYGFIPKKGFGKNGQGYNSLSAVKKHPGIRPKRVMQNASKKAIKSFPKISARNFSRFIKV